jgi:sulfoxide reductase heme-binding subunit YedZ
MTDIRAVFNSPYFLWALLAIPSLPMAAGLAGGTANVESLLHPTGEFAARFMIIAMAISPLRLIFPNARWPVWLARRRRALGVAAFGYALVHTVFYIVDLASLRAMLDEFFALGIWTGWVALAIFLPLGATSNNLSQRRLGRLWKPLQRCVYAAAVLTLLHWIFVHNNIGPALVHFIPLALLEGWRITQWRSLRPQPAANSRS